jgi:hypothetical protein
MMCLRCVPPFLFMTTLGSGSVCYRPFMVPDRGTLLGRFRHFMAFLWPLVIHASWLVGPDALDGSGSMMSSALFMVQATWMCL